MVNKWKAAFFILAGLIIIFLITGIGWVNNTFPDPEEGERGFEAYEFEDREGASFTVNTTREDLNYWLQQELAKEEDSDKYELYIEDAVYMETTVQAFGVTIPIEMVLSPHVTEEGNLELREESFRVGNINLPSSRVFQLISATVDLPDWIYVVPEESLFYVNVREGVSEDMVLQIQSFDLENNDIEIHITYDEW